MGKKGSWFSAIKRVFTTSSRNNFLDTKVPTQLQDFQNKLTREKKRWGFGKSKHGQISSLISLRREPSSIEQILEDVESEQHQRIHVVPPPNKVQQSKAAAPKPKIIPKYAHISAIKIQAAYRGYRARRSYRALKGLLRLQRVLRGQSVKRQTANTMRCMQMLVRVQTQIHARRLQMLESRNLQAHQITPRKGDRDAESNFGKWIVARQSEASGHGEWDDSLLTKEELEARMRRKVEAVIKRERALAYAYSHQVLCSQKKMERLFTRMLLKVTPRSAEAMLTGLRSGSSPWWWTWLDRQLPSDIHSSSAPPPAETPGPATVLRPRVSPAPTPTPALTPPQQHRHKYNPRLKPGEADDASLASCPPFAVPSYMAPTASAKAKVRAHRASQEGPKKKRFSFGLSQSIGSLFSGKEAVPDGGSVCRSERAGGRQGRHRSTPSVGGVSVDSVVSMPVGAFGGRRRIK